MIWKKVATVEIYTRNYYKTKKYLYIKYNHWEEDVTLKIQPSSFLQCSRSISKTSKRFEITSLGSLQETDAMGLGRSLLATMGFDKENNMKKREKMRNPLKENSHSKDLKFKHHKQVLSGRRGCACEMWLRGKMKGVM